MANGLCDLIFSFLGCLNDFLSTQLHRYFYLISLLDGLGFQNSFACLVVRKSRSSISSRRNLCASVSMWISVTQSESSPLAGNLNSSARVDSFLLGWWIQSLSQSAHLTICTKFFLPRFSIVFPVFTRHFSWFWLACQQLWTTGTKAKGLQLAEIK